MRKLILLFFLSLLITAVNAQEKISISGKVVDNTGFGLPGVSILEKGTMNGTVTNVNGDYTLQASAQSTLVFSFIGFVTQEIPVGGRTAINVSMVESVVGLDEVIVVGYGKMVVKDLTSSITTVKADELVKSPSGQAMQALQGKVAGLQVVSSGAPGDAPTIRVRGIGSYPGRENEAPLYVVDGIFYDNIDFLNTADIASISVLKDASAAAIYGVRAANGVVLIETKSGGYEQEAEITYDGYYGTQVAQNVLKMANAEQFTAMAMESGSAADASFVLNAMQKYGRSRVNPNVPDVNTDWYKEILRPAPIQNHSLNVTGGSKQASYSIGTNYFAQDGILDMKNQYERFNLRSKIDYKAAKWLTIGGNMVLSNALKYNDEAGAWNQAYFAVPILPITDETNTAAWPYPWANAQDLGYRGGQNPFPTLSYNENQLKIKKLLTSFYAQLEILPEKLSFKTSYSHAFTSLDERNANLPYYLGDGFQRSDATLTKRMSNFSNQTLDNVLTYTDRYDEHRFIVMAGHSYRDEAYHGLSAQGLNFPYEQEQAWYIDQAETVPPTGVYDDGLRQYGISYFGRLSYNYGDKYLLYATMRADGSSKYQQKWGYFPTIGAGWVISEEKFMENVKVFNFLKLRASWGQLGNDKIQASDGASTTTVVNTVFNGVMTSGTTTTSTFSSLKWELTEETNVGLTTRMFGNQLSADFDYYVRDTKNAAIFVKIPSTTSSVLRNVGVIRNSGFELSLNWTNEVSDNLSYNVGANFSTLKNEVRDLYGQPYIDGGMAEFRQRSIVGEPLLAFFGYKVLGVYQTQSEIDADPSAPADAVPGDFKYQDQQKQGEPGYGVINDDDRVVLGSYFPSFMYGFNLGITYRDFEFSASMMGQTGNKILNRKRGEIIWTAGENMDADLAINRWHGPGTSNKYPSSAGLRRGWNQKMSDYFVEDGAFFRIQNLQLAYNIRDKKISGFDVPESKIILTAERPLTLFKYNGFNPEVANGIDTQTYPIPAVYTIGLSVKF